MTRPSGAGAAGGTGGFGRNLWFGGLFLLSVFVLPRVWPQWTRGSLAALAASQLVLVTAAVAVAAVLGIGGAVLATRPAGRAFRPSIEAVSVIGQTFPPAAVLALLVPVLGYGAAPTLAALTLYGLLPITASTLAGIEAVPAPVREAAVGVGFSPWQVLCRVELVLARPMILSGLRLAALVGLGTATIGSTVGAATLGTPIIDGMISGKPGLVVAGALPLALLAVVVDGVFERGGKDRQGLCP